MSHQDSPHTATHTNPQLYRSILLRCWREEDTAVWRYMVHDVSTSEQYNFANLDLLIAFLYQQLETQICQTHITDSTTDIPVSY
ncbi:MAG TPA: hypothetical protein VLL52_19685 [Anaerolineae bacterium]|nr:hypothetical protein [Anaerolineae bacterium]